MAGQFVALERAMREQYANEPELEDVLLGFWYLDRLPAGDEARRVVDAAFADAMRVLVLGKLEREMATAATSEDIRRVAKLMGEVQGSARRFEAAD